MQYNRNRTPVSRSRRADAIYKQNIKDKAKAAGCGLLGCFGGLVVILINILIPVGVVALIVWAVVAILRSYGVI